MKRHVQTTLQGGTALDDSSESRIWPFFTKIFGGRHDQPIEDAIREAQEDGELKADEVAMLHNVLRLGRKRVQDIIIPRPDIVCAEVDDNVEDIARLLIESGHSRLPIFRDNKDNIIGIVHAKDLLKILLEADALDVNVSQVMRQTFFIPETKNVLDLLQEFKARKIHLAIALDEYGGTSGLVTFEDVLEEIVGEIEDEYDTPRPADIRELENHDILVSGRTPLIDLEEHLSIALDSEQVETVGGYLCELAGRVPAVGENFSLAGHRFTVKEADAKQIRWILIHPQQPLSPQD